MYLYYLLDQIILMSGISKNALEELSSERSSEDRIPHFCNILRFAILKKDRSFMAIGGPWQSSDGGDPSVDADALVQTALRFVLCPTCVCMREREHCCFVLLVPSSYPDMQRMLRN